MRKTRLLPSLAAPPPSPTPLSRPIPASKEEEQQRQQHQPERLSLALTLMATSIESPMRSSVQNRKKMTKTPSTSSNRVDQLQIDLRIASLKLEIMETQKGVLYRQNGSDDVEYCELQLRVAEAERALAKMERKLKAAELERRDVGKRAGLCASS